MNIKQFREKIENERGLRLGSVYDELLFADMLRIKNKLEKYCPDVCVKGNVVFYHKSLKDAQTDTYSASYVVLYYVVLQDMDDKKFAIARLFGQCEVQGVHKNLYFDDTDDEITKNQKLNNRIDQMLNSKKQDIILNALDDDMLKDATMLLWKDHIPYYRDGLVDTTINKNITAFEPLYITRCADAHRLSIYLPKMNKIMWEIVDENIETLKLKRAREITEFIKSKHKAIENKQSEISNIEKEIAKAQDRKEEILHDYSCKDLDLVLMRKK